MTGRGFRACGPMVLAAMMLSCGRGGQPPGPSNDLLIIGYDREPDTMNRYATHILEDIESCVVEGLVVNDEQLNPVPVLASEIPTLANGGVRLRPDGGMDVTWRLRPGVRWHDGTLHTSADVAFTVAAITKGDWHPESVDGFDRISGVDTPDSLTAVVHYREVYAPYVWQFVRGTLPKHLLEGRSIEAATDYNRAPLGTGPYRVKEWRTGEYLLLERAPGHWRGDSVPAIRQLLFRFIPNTNTRITLLAAGEVHMVALVPWDKVRELKSVPEVRLNRVVGNGYEHVSLNQARVPAFTDVRVRRALAHAVDRPTLVRTILDDLVEVVNGPIQPLSPAYEPAVRGYGYAPDSARALLDAAGWQVGADGIRVKDGRRLAFTLLTQAGFAIRESVAQALQQQWKAVGAEVQVQTVDGTAISSLWFNGTFDAMLHWWQSGADPEITLFFAGDRAPPRGRNINHLNDASLTDLLYRSDRTVDAEARFALLREAQRRVADLAPEVVLYNTAKVDAVPARLQGFTGNPSNAGPFWNVHQWRIAPP